ncbi:DUF1643 domain-containing protein [Sulfurimonas sp. SAG-AH-194-C21]|nr:DUF1643 domain-containing protein [Sulfurimonas sp. SAG-AH-194-C21]MDF1884550.1 DUF1643 domain-containing protein [Sulfurimonas sp. SAG-AH-194-C21]
MSTNFKINGLFYENNNLLCRKFLDIRRTKTILDKPDLMVIMMNPGSSKPEDGNEKNIVASKAIPDKTQDQIMKIMNNCDFYYARILNLSDLREPKSKVFYTKLEELKKIPHSIFDDDRINDFKTLFVREVPVIFAWGVNKKLEPLATKAIERINEARPFGLLKEGTAVSYYHPLPRDYHAQARWCEEITKMLK